MRTSLVVPMLKFVILLHAVVAYLANYMPFDVFSSILENPSFIPVSVFALPNLWYGCHCEH